MSLVARKREAARQRLIEVAARLISERGTEGLRLREICTAADIGMGSFYSHFATKEELVEAVVADHVANVAESIITRASREDDPAEVAALAHRLFIQLTAEDRQLAWLLVRLDHGDALLETASLPRFGPVLERGIASGRFAPLNVEVMVSFIVGATLSVMRGLLEGRLAPDAGGESARILLGACGLSDQEARRIAARPLSAPSATAVKPG
jgi:AcrR family transcriptional regulator